jgi:hypothetical protein
MDRARACRAEVDRGDVLQGVDPERDGEIAEHIGAVGAERVRMVECDDEVGLAETPLRETLCRRRSRTAVAARHSAVDPPCDRRDFVVGEGPCADERTADASDRFPRRHVASGCRVGYRTAALPHGVVAVEAERRDVAVAVAADALPPQDRFDVRCVSRSRRLRGRRGATGEPDRRAENRPDARAEKYSGHPSCEC